MLVLFFIVPHARWRVYLLKNRVATSYAIFVIL